MSRDITPISYKTVPGRARTQKWNTAKQVDYGGDEWGGYDDYDDYQDDQQPPPLPSAIPASQAPRDPYASARHARQNSFDQGDETRAFSSGVHPASNANDLPEHEEHTPGRSSGRDFTNPEQVPAPLSMHNSPAPAQGERWPGRKESMSSGSGSTPPISGVAAVNTPDKPLPFIRPSDIYKRIPDEIRRQSEDGARPSMDSIGSGARERVGLGLEPVAESRESRLYLDGAESRSTLTPRSGKSSSPRLPDVTRFSGFGTEFLTGSPSLNETSEISSASPHSPEAIVSRVANAPVVGTASPSSSIQTTPITRALPGQDPAADILAERQHDRSVESIAGGQSANLHHQPSAGFRSAVHTAFDRNDNTISRDNSQGSADVHRSDTNSTAGISPIISRGAQFPSIAEETARSRTSDADFEPGYRRSLDPPSTGTSPARTPGLQSVEGKRLSTPMSAETMQAEAPDVLDQGAEMPTATLQPMKTPASEVGELRTSTAPLPITGRGRSGTDYSMREADIAQTVNSSSPEQRHDMPVLIDAQRDSQKLFLQTHVEKQPPSPISPGGGLRDGGSGSRAGSPAKGRVREIADRYHGLDKAARRNSAASVSSSSKALSTKSSWSNFDEGEKKLVRSGTDQSGSDMFPAYDNADLAPPRPGVGREESFRPDLPGGWISSAPSPALEDGTRGGRASPLTPQSTRADEEELTPTTKKTRLQEALTNEPSAREISEAQPQSALDQVKNAGSELGAALMASVGMGHQTRDFASAEPAAPVDSEVQKPARGIQPPTLFRHETDSDASVASTMPPSPPAKDTPKIAETLSAGYFNTVAPLRVKSREQSPVAERGLSLPRPGVTTALSTDPTAEDLESDRLRKEIVRSLDPIRPGDDLAGRENVGPPADSKGVVGSRPHQPAQLQTRFSWENPTPMSEEVMPSPEIKPERAYERPRSKALHVVNPNEVESPMVETPVGRAPPEDASRVDTFGTEKETFLPETDVQPGSPTQSLKEVAPSPTSEDNKRQSYYAADTTHSPTVMPGQNGLSTDKPSSASTKPIPPFRNILALKTGDERIKTYNETRATFASMNTGLGDWVTNMLALHPELASTSPPLQTSGTFKAGGHKSSPSIAKFTNKFSSDSPSDAAGDTPTFYATPTSGGTVRPVTSGPSASTTGLPNFDADEIKQKGKAFMQKTGVLGGKAQAGAKGLFAKGKSRFASGGSVRSPSGSGGGGGGNDKVLSPSSAAGFFHFGSERKASAGVAEGQQASSVGEAKSVGEIGALPGVGEVKLAEEDVLSARKQVGAGEAKSAGEDGAFPARQASAGDDMAISAEEDARSTLSQVSPGGQVGEVRLAEESVHLRTAGTEAVALPVGAAEAVVLPAGSVDEAAENAQSRAINVSLPLAVVAAVPVVAALRTNAEEEETLSVKETEKNSAPAPPIGEQDVVLASITKDFEETLGVEEPVDLAAPDTKRSVLEKETAELEQTTTTPTILTTSSIQPATGTDSPTPISAIRPGFSRHSSSKSASPFRSNSPFHRDHSQTPASESRSRPQSMVDWLRDKTRSVSRSGHRSSRPASLVLERNDTPASSSLAVGSSDLTPGDLSDVAVYSSSTTAPIAIPSRLEAWNSPDATIPPKTPETRELVSERLGILPSPAPTAVTFEEGRRRRRSSAAAMAGSVGGLGLDLETVPSKESGGSPVRSGSNGGVGRGSPVRPGTLLLRKVSESEEVVMRPRKPFQQEEEEEVVMRPRQQRKVSDLETLPSELKRLSLGKPRPDSEILLQSQVDLLAGAEKDENVGHNLQGRPRERDIDSDAVLGAEGVDSRQVAAEKSRPSTNHSQITADVWDDARSEVSAEDGAVEEAQRASTNAGTSRHSSVSSLGAPDTAAIVVNEPMEEPAMSSRAVPAGPLPGALLSPTAAAASAPERPPMPDRPLSYMMLPRDEAGIPIPETITRGSLQQANATEPLQQTDTTPFPPQATPAASSQQIDTTVPLQQAYTTAPLQQTTTLSSDESSVPVDLSALSGPPPGTPPFQQHPVFRNSVVQIDATGDPQKAVVASTTGGITTESGDPQDKRQSGFFSNQPSGTSTPFSGAPPPNRITDQHGLENLQASDDEVPDIQPIPRDRQQVDNKQDRRRSGLWDALKPKRSSSNAKLDSGGEYVTAPSDTAAKPRDAEKKGKLQKPQRAASSAVNSQPKSKRISALGSIFGRSGTTGHGAAKPNKLTKAIPSGSDNGRRMGSPKADPPANSSSVSGNIQSYQEYEAIRKRDLAASQGSAVAIRPARMYEAQRPEPPPDTAPVQPPPEGWYGRPSGEQQRPFSPAHNTQPELRRSSSEQQRPFSPAQHPQSEFRRLHSQGGAGARYVAQVPPSFRPVEASFNGPVAPVGPPPDPLSMQNPRTSPVRANGHARNPSFDRQNSQTSSYYGSEFSGFSGPQVAARGQYYPPSQRPFGPVVSPIMTRTGPPPGQGQRAVSAGYETARSPAKDYPDQQTPWAITIPPGQERLQTVRLSPWEDAPEETQYPGPPPNAPYHQQQQQQYAPQRGYQSSGPYRPAQEIPRRSYDNDNGAYTPPFSEPPQQQYHHNGAPQIHPYQQQQQFSYPPRPRQQNRYYSQPTTPQHFPPQQPYQGPAPQHFPPQQGDQGPAPQQYDSRMHHRRRSSGYNGRRDDPTAGEEDLIMRGVSYPGQEWQPPGLGRSGWD